MTQPLLPTALFATLVACSTPEVEARRDEARASSTSSSMVGAKLDPPRLVPVPAGLKDGRAWVLAELAANANRPVILYVGATWCEPCKAFHDALAAGALDDELAGAIFLEFDLDQHGALLGPEDLACESKLVPLFARPNADGTCGAQRAEGGLKGAQALASVVPRVKKLIAAR